MDSLEAAPIKHQKSQRRQNDNLNSFHVVLPRRDIVSSKKIVFPEICHIICLPVQNTHCATAKRCHVVTHLFGHYNDMSIRCIVQSSSLPVHHFHPIKTGPRKLACFVSLSPPALSQVWSLFRERIAKDQCGTPLFRLPTRTMAAVPNSNSDQPITLLQSQFLVDDDETFDENYKNGIDNGGNLPWKELQGETHLMDELDDDQEPMMGSTTTTSERAVLNHVPMNELKHDFTLHDDTTKTVPSERNHRNSATSIDGEDEKATASSLFVKSPSRRGSGLDSNNKSSRRVSSTRTQSTVAVRRRTRRQSRLSAAENLFGYCAALEAIHEAEKNIGDDAEEDDDMEEIATTQSGRNKKYIKDKTTTGRFSTVAGMMYDRVHKSKGTKKIQREEENYVEAVPTKQNETTSPRSKNRWKSSREKIVDYKKSDDPRHERSHESFDLRTDIEQGHDNGSEEEIPSARTSDIGTEKEKNEKKKKAPVNQFLHLPNAILIRTEWELFQEFIHPKRSALFRMTTFVISAFSLPALLVAAVLYSAFDNPPTGRGPTDSPYASASWWLLFICLRQPVLVLMAKIMEIHVIDFLALRTKVTLRILGPAMTLLLIQSKGWPFRFQVWGVLNLLLVVGNTSFAHHWLYWQDWLGLFNSNNPSGNVTSSHEFALVCYSVAFLGLVVSIKRLALSIVLGRQMYCTWRMGKKQLLQHFLNHHFSHLVFLSFYPSTTVNYSQPLAKIMQKMVHVSEVAALAREINNQTRKKVLPIQNLQITPQPKHHRRRSQNT